MELTSKSHVNRDSEIYQVKAITFIRDGNKSILIYIRHICIDRQSLGSRCERQNLTSIQ